MTERRIIGYAQVLVDVVLTADEIVPSEHGVFDYAVDETFDSLTCGHVVTVPFGNRKLRGYVLNLEMKTEVDPQNIRFIETLQWPLPLFSFREVELARWISARYLCALLPALKMFLPLGIDSGKSLFSTPPQQLIPTITDIDEAEMHLDRAPKQRTVLCEALQAKSPQTRSELARSGGSSPSTVDALIRKGLLRWVAMDGETVPPLSDAESTAEFVLSRHQSEALEEILPALQASESKVFMLRGITGSGKTEVYLQAIAQVLEGDQQAILMVPEISLTPQMIRQVIGRFGSDEVVLWHSGMSVSERNRSWQRIYEGKARVVLGARSALFAPCTRLALIIIDEEHENSYKQDQTPRYHTREVAEARARMTDSVLLLGSATPSLESYHRSQCGQYRELLLPHRIDDRALPAIELLDMRRERAAGQWSLFGRRLHQAIRDRLSRGEQVVLFLNHRGYSAFLICADCGLTMRCSACNVTFTYHRDGVLRCHYCNREAAPPERCPGCGGHDVHRRGLGTQKVEAAVHAAFPGARVARMDTDSVRRKGSRQSIYHQFLQGNIDILVGTQMIAKGWDVPGVTLVGIIDADTALHFPDFRSSERTFQMITQVAGRAGRGDTPGEVIAQTRNPDHPALQFARCYDLEGFYARELNDRQALSYPPFAHLIRLVVRGEREDLVEAWAEEVLRRLSQLSSDEVLLGPAPAPLTRLRGLFRWHLFIKTKSLSQTLAEIPLRLEGLKPGRQDPRIVVDVDPMQML